MSASPLIVLAPAAFSIALDGVATAYSRETGRSIAMTYGPAAGPVANSIESRISSVNGFDVAFLPQGLMAKGADAGRILPASVVDVMRSSVGACVRSDSASTQIGSVAALVDTLKRSSWIAVSAAGSGIYVSQVLLKRLGLEEDLKDRLLTVTSEPVAAVVKRGDAEIGFQQLAELLHVYGVKILGPIPAEVQSYTVIAGGVSAGSKRADDARDYLQFVESAAARPALEAGGVDHMQATPLRNLS